MASGLSDFGRIVGKVFRWIRTLSLGLIVVVAVLLGLRVAELYGAIRAVHPLLGWAFLLALGLGLWLLVGRPLVHFLRMPVVMKPPKLPPPDERRPRHLVRHLEFVERYVSALPSNPHWDGSRDDLERAVAHCRALRSEAGRAREEDLPQLQGRIASLELDDVGRLLAPLDRKASALIRDEALKVGLATAVSPYGMLDAFLVLWRNVNLVSRLADVYYGRPGTRGTLKVLRDVSMATMVGAYLQDLGHVAGEFAGGLVGKTAGMLTGPLMEGCLNGVATLRIGYVAKGRCRAFSAWSEKSAPRIAHDAVVEAAAQSAGLVKDIATTVGGGVVRLTGKALTGFVDRIATVFRRSPAGEEPLGA